jgi:hypothetical protein
MGHKPTGHAVGRPNLSIDWEEVDRHLEAGCSGAEVASIVGVSPDTLYRRCQTERGANFSVILQQKKAKGEAMLKVRQFSEAMKGDRSMLIWLGKQRLGQRDRQEVVADICSAIGIIHYGTHSNPSPWKADSEIKLIS